VPRRRRNLSLAPAALLAAALFARGAAADQPASARDVPAPVSSLPAAREGERFSFKAVDMDIRQALALFAESNDLNIIPDRDVQGQLTVSFRDLPLDLAMEALLSAHGYYFVKTGNLIRVRNLQTRLFQIDYIHAVRSGSGSNDISFSSRQGSHSEDQGTTMNVTASTVINFWETLESQLAGMVSEAGSYTINSLAGVISVTDRFARMQEIAAFIGRISDNVARQIEIDVEIYEVSLDKSFQLGIDWTRVSDSLDATFGGNLSFGAQSPGGALAPATFTVDFQRGGTTALIEALEQQGDLSILSKPRLRTINNQPAVIRVGQDLPVFRQLVVQSPGDPPVITTQEEIENVTIGTVLSITPQIASDGMITLDISPAISRLVRNEVSAVTGSSAPVIDVRQASSIVRIQSGDTVVLGGLVQEESTRVDRKVPLLGDIPILGRAFRGTRDVSSKSELVVILTPRIAE